MRVPITACQEPASHHLRPPLSLHVDIVGTVDHNTDESDIFLQLRPFPLPRTPVRRPWARLRIFSFDLRRVCVDAFNDAPLLGDDPDDAIRSASATSASAISS